MYSTFVLPLLGGLVTGGILSHNVQASVGSFLLVLRSDGVLCWPDFYASLKKIISRNFFPLAHFVFDIIFNM